MAAITGGGVISACALLLALLGCGLSFAFIWVGLTRGHIRTPLLEAARDFCRCFLLPGMSFSVSAWLFPHADDGWRLGAAILLVLLHAVWALHRCDCLGRRR